MASLTFNIGGATAKHDLSVDHQTRLLAVMKVRMAQSTGWPMDLTDPDNPKRREPTALETAQWVADHYLMALLKEEVMEEEKRVARNAAASAVAAIDSTKV